MAGSGFFSGEEGVIATQPEFKWIILKLTPQEESFLETLKFLQELQEEAFQAMLLPRVGLMNPKGSSFDMAQVMYSGIRKGNP